MNDDFLNQFRKAPRTEFAAMLYKRISKPMQTQTKHLVPRFAALTLSLFTVLIMALLFSPSARAFAQGLLKQIGGYAFTQGVPDPIDASRVPIPINMIETSTRTRIEINSNSNFANDPVTAGDLAGFTVLVPSYLPAGYTPMEGGWRITTMSNSTAVTNGYFDGTKHYVLIAQWKVGEGDEKSFTRDEIIDVTVRGQNGVWLPPASSDNRSSALIWDEDGITYSIISNALSLDEALMVAESLGQ
jgi:hypothetical protein